MPPEVAGFVAVYADGNGARGRLLGVSDKLPAGTTRNVRIRARPPIGRSAKIHLVLHADDDHNGKFGAPEHDRAVGSPSGVVSVAIRYEVAR